jgi:hypothetical protein
MLRYAQQSLAMPRRTVLALGLAASAGLATPSVARAEAGNVKITVLYGEPKEPPEFGEILRRNAYARGARREGIKHIELAKAPEGAKPALLSRHGAVVRERRTTVQGVHHARMEKGRRRRSEFGHRRCHCDIV